MSNVLGGENVQPMSTMRAKNIRLEILSSRNWKQQSLLRRIFNLYGSADGERQTTTAEDLSPKVVRETTAFIFCAPEVPSSWAEPRAFI